MKNLISLAVILAATGVAFSGEMEQAAVSVGMKNLDLQTIRTMDTSSLANPVPQRDVSFGGYPYYTKSCMSWGFGYSGTFGCPSGYMGAVRTCFAKDQDGNQVAVWQEEGCGDLSDPNGGTGYCVRGCDNSGWKSAALGAETLKAPVSAAFTKAAEKTYEKIRWEDNNIGSLPVAKPSELPQAAKKQLQDDKRANPDYPSNPYKMTVQGKMVYAIENDNDGGMFVNIYDADGVFIAYGSCSESGEFSWADSKDVAKAASRLVSVSVHLSVDPAQPFST
jgi:hypothetical protein